MAKDLRDTWKSTGIGLGHAFRDLGKSIIKSGATAVKKADKWANSEDYEEQDAVQQSPEAQEQSTEEQTEQLTEQTEQNQKD